MDNKMYYKGFDKNLSCRKFQYKVGETYTHDGALSLCRKGFHFCYKLQQCFNFYSRSSDNRFCLVEVAEGGEVLKGEDKLVTSKIKIVKELTDEEIERIIVEEEKRARLEELNIDVIKELQENYNIFFAGSTALYLYGLDLEREAGDLDVIMPYYQKITPENHKDSIIDEIEEFDAKSSGNDFNCTFAMTTNDGRFIKVDVRINPEQPYDRVEFQDFKYNLSKLEDIIEAKARYWKEGNKKHGDDLKMLMGIKDKPKTQSSLGGIFNLI